MPIANDQRLEEVRRIVAEVLEREPDEIVDTADFQRTYDADSLRAIEILSRIEKTFGVEIPQTELPRMQNLQAVHEVLVQYADSVPLA